MAFPTIQTGDSQHGVQASNANPWTLTYPTNLASGDLILACLAIDGAPANLNNPNANFNYGVRSSGGAVLSMVLSRVSNGTETGTFSVDVSGSEQGGWRIMRITGWYGSGSVGDANTSVQQNSDGISIFSATGTNTTPDPPSLDPANWATEDTLWIATCAVDTSRTFSAWPTSYSPGNNTWDDVSGGAGGASLSVQWRNNTVSSEDPGTWTISTSDDWAGQTIAIRPAAAAAPGHVHKRKRLDRFMTMR